MPCRGCSAGVRSICQRTSGEQLSRNQASPSALTAAEDWVRGLAAGSPARARAQLPQAQFHWGKPPPAADPRMMIRMTVQAPAGREPTGAITRPQISAQA